METTPKDTHVQLKEIYEAVVAGKMSYDKFCSKLKRYYAGGYRIDTSNQSLDDLVVAFCDTMNVKKEMMFSRCRVAWIIRYRSFFFKIAHEAGFGWTEIGRYVGLTHCNIMYNYHHLNDELKFDKMLMDEFIDVSERVLGACGRAEVIAPVRVNG
jgi:hypothetical protein